MSDTPKSEQDNITNDLNPLYDLATMALQPNAASPTPEQVKNVLDAAFRIASRVLKDLNRLADSSEKIAESLEGIRKRSGG